MDTNQPRLEDWALDIWLTKTALAHPLTSKEKIMTHAIAGQF